MAAGTFLDLLGPQTGLVGPDAYNTAWVAMVPAPDDRRQPAWPQALAYLRRNQLPDGGWGDGGVFYAHERTIATTAALRALLEWDCPPDDPIIQRGVAALHRYAADLAAEPYEPIGFELLLPRLAVDLERFQLTLPVEGWNGIERLAQQKVALTGTLQPDYARPRSWWFNMEMLLEYQLAEFDERLLNQHGSIAISPAATAAFLRAHRLVGKDSPRAAAFLDHVVGLSGGGAGVCYPVEGFELIWTLDAYMRAGLAPDHAALAPLIRWLADYWLSSPDGLSHSQAFPLADGDDTAVGYKVLRWTGLAIDDAPLRRFWNGDRQQFLTFPDERTASVSAAVHALYAFRHDATNPAHIEIVGQLTDQLREGMRQDGKLQDKWHLSPLYATTRVIPALIGWDDMLARQCIDLILDRQRPDGGWGSGYRSNLEETGHAILGLVSARRAGLLRDSGPLRAAALYLSQHNLSQPQERLWIGKALYQPIGVVRSLIDAARVALHLQGINLSRVYWPLQQPSEPSPREAAGRRQPPLS